MDWYLKHRLVKYGNGYIIEIYLNADSAEFGSEFMSHVNEKVMQLDEKIKKLVDEKFSKIKINYVKLILGTLIVATVPYLSATSALAATASIQETAMNATGTVVTNTLNMRSGPATTYTILHVLWRGNQVRVIDESGNWYRIELSDGVTGWVYRSYLQINSKQGYIDKVIATAQSLIGIPYVYGGESLGGFDCSGLTQYVFNQAGYQLNRDSVDQAQQGIYETPSTLQPGDLVFYSFTGNGVVSHVGIYIGNGQMINSPSPGETVKITDINVSYWQSRFVTARRIIY